VLLNVALAVALMASSLILVRTAYETRRLFNALERAQMEARQLEVDQQRLETDRLAQATPLRVEKLARERLQMRSATPAITHYVNAGTGSVLGSASATPPETVKP
jgi:cell division protein FtsL